MKVADFLKLKFYTKDAELNTKELWEKHKSMWCLHFLTKFKTIQQISIELANILASKSMYHSNLVNIFLPLPFPLERTWSTYCD